jgi:pyrroline-5-carboxylate reductase
MEAASSPSSQPLVGFIGAGNMARALAGGLLASGYARQRLILSDPLPEQREGAARALGLEVYADNKAVAERAEVLVFAVKPQTLAAAAREVAEIVQRRLPLVVSVAAGVRTADLERWLSGGGGEGLAIVRAMPNTAALVGSGAAGLYANARVDETQREIAESLLRAVGVAVWVEREELLDVVTALSGSGPAYFFLLMEILEEEAIAHGLAPAQARLLVCETAFGAAKMALEGAEEPARLRARVTSPGGTTEAAVRVLEEGGLRGLFRRAFAAAVARARELAELFGKNA